MGISGCRAHPRSRVRQRAEIQFLEPPTTRIGTQPQSSCDLMRSDTVLHDSIAVALPVLTLSKHLYAPGAESVSHTENTSVPHELMEVNDLQFVTLAMTPSSVTLV